MGFIDYGVRKVWPGITYNIMSCGGPVTLEDYNRVYNEFWEIIEPLEDSQ